MYFLISKLIKTLTSFLQIPKKNTGNSNILRLIKRPGYGLFQAYQIAVLHSKTPTMQNRLPFKALRFGDKYYFISYSVTTKMQRGREKYRALSVEGQRYPTYVSLVSSSLQLQSISFPGKPFLSYSPLCERLSGASCDQRYPIDVLLVSLCPKFQSILVCNKPF